MDLDLELFDKTRIREPSTFKATIVRDLTAADVELIRTVTSAPKKKEGDVSITLIDKITARHHQLAKHVATGMPNWQAAAATGYTESRVSVIKGSPAFKQLVEHYKQKQDEQYVDLHTELAGMTQDSIRMLRDRMEDAPEKFSNGQLLEMSKMGADRVGHGPSSSTHHKHEHTIGMAERMQAGRKRVEDRSKVIDEIPIDITPKTEDAA